MATKDLTYVIVMEATTDLRSTTTSISKTN